MTTAVRRSPPRLAYVRACGGDPCPYHRSGGQTRSPCRDTPVQVGRRGFPGMTPEERSRIASLGGIAAHKAGTAHEFTAEEAAAAGRKGGLVVSQNRKYMSQIGRKGGGA